MTIFSNLFEKIKHTFIEFIKFFISGIGGLFALALFPTLLVLVPLLVAYLVLSGALTFVNISNSLGDLSRSLLGFSSAVILILGIPLIYILYRSKSYSRREYYKRRKEKRLSSSEQGVETMLFWSETGTNQIIGFGSIFIVFIFVTVRLSVDFMPIFFVLNIASWLISSAIYRLKYCPIKLANPSLGTFEKPSSEFRKLQEIQIAIWGIPLLAALVSGFIEYTAANQ